jgi:hypothetical protein
MANLNLKVTKKQIVFGEDSVIIQKWIAGIKGGRALNVEGIIDNVLHAGRVIITDGKGTYKPLPIKDSAYDALPEGYSYAGILYRSIRTEEGGASIMTEGQVNEIAAKNANGVDIPAAFKTACPLIEFVTDENAGTFADTDATQD